MMLMGQRTSRGRLTAVATGAALALLYQPVALAVVTEVFVTARKIEENIQDIPLSVTPFDAKQITELNLRNVEDISRFTPGFSYDSNFGRQPISARPAVRGITTILNSSAGTSAASFFVDGIYVVGTPQVSELYNLERVEIVKGPQSAQFGRGTYAGAINFITRKPSMDEVQGGVKLTGAEHDTYEASGWVSAPIIENKLAFYAGVGFDTYGGEYKNQRTGETIGGQESISGTGKLLWTPIENLSITLKGGFLETEDEHFPIYLQGRSDNNCYFRSADAPRAREYYCGKAFIDKNDISLLTDGLREIGGISGYEISRRLTSLTVEYEDPNGYTFSSITGYAADDAKSGQDVSYYAYDPTPQFGEAARGSFFQIDKDESSSFTQEFRVTSPQDRAVRGTAGVYLLKIKAEEIYNYKLRPVSLSLQPLPPPNPDVPLSSLLELRLQQVNLTTDQIRNQAMFGGIEFDLGDQWTLGAELRYAKERVRETNFFNNPPADDPTSLTPVEALENQFERTFSSLTPRFTARYRLSDDVNLYGNVGKGTKPGGFNSTVPDESFRSYKEETIWAYEIGAKTRWLDRRLVLDVAGYYNNITDGQFTRNVEVDGIPQSVRANVGEYDVWGFELESSFAVTDDWILGVSYGFADATYVENNSVDQADLLGSIGTLADLERLGSTRGNRMPRIPKHQAAVFTRYDRPVEWGSMGSGTFYVGADYTFQGSRYAAEHNLIETGDNQLVGARIGATVSNWDFSVWARNLFDDDTPVDIQRYIDRRPAEGGGLPSCASFAVPGAICTGSSTSARGFGVALPRGRQIGATLAYRFGATQ